MKNNLRMLGLPLCRLPMCLHAGTGQDLKPAYQPTQGRNTRSAEPIPAGTIVPVSLYSALHSDEARSRAAVTVTVMQDVPLDRGETLRRGSRLTGHVVEAITSGKGWTSGGSHSSSIRCNLATVFAAVSSGDRSFPRWTATPGRGAESRTGWMR